MERVKVSVGEGYARWAAGYDTYANGLVFAEEPLTRALLCDGPRDVRGKRVLDVACGTGRHTIWLAEQGARVTAVDASKEMLAIAKTKAAAVDIEWLEGDVEALPVPDASFDLVLSALVMEHVKEIAPAFREAHRALVPGGSFVMSVYHPAFLWKGVPPHFKSQSDAVEYEMPAYVHLPSEYVQEIFRLGMELVHFSEPLVDDALVTRHPKWEKHRGLPVAILIKATKRAG